jgi:hypothetical protein
MMYQVDIQHDTYNICEGLIMVDFDTNEFGSMGSEGQKVIGKKSWVVYVGLLVRYTIIFSVIYFIDISLSGEPYFSWIKEYFLYAYAFFGIIFVYRFAVLFSYKIYVTNEGVWLSYGILPWAKGGNGLRWNDADMAFYYPSFLSWITNSYTITVNHKYTNSSDFKVSKIWRGRKVCSEISSIQRSRLGV